MSKQEINIVIIGAGNVATHLGKALVQGNNKIIQVYNRTLEKAHLLGELLSCPFTDQVSLIDATADLYLVAVSDRAIAEVATQIAFLNQHEKLVVHTSGSTPSKVLEGQFQRFGVFYPLQSFSLDQAVDFLKIPICLYASKKEDKILLQKLALSISHQVYEMDDEQRNALHVAAVFVNNFSNHLYYLMDELLREEGLPFSLLHPLIEATAQKLKTHSPAQAQTGPALRGDLPTIERHLAFLSQKEPALLSELYIMMTESIHPALLKEKNK
ncbi:MAG: Rossmann-like and DUF2520 domain-containing protein [Saprospiraceae bacterium]